MRRAETAADRAPCERLRFDKWLWAARFYKTRALAAEAIEAGQARIGGERVKPAHPLRQGEQVTVRRSALVWEVTVLALSDRRGGAVDAAKLYRETDDSVRVREEAAAQQRAARQASPLPGRPTKRQRRKLEDFLNEP